MGRIIDKISERRRQRLRALGRLASTASACSSSARHHPSDDSHHHHNNNNNNNNDKSSNSSSSSNPPFFYSFEFFPPKTEAGLDNLLTRIDRMAHRLDPLFVDVTWGEAGSTSARTLAVAAHAQRFCGVDVLMHLTCTGLTREQLSNHLNQAKICGVRNILALRGDPPRGKVRWEPNDVSGGECERAIDLVKLIRELHGSYFGIAVAGHPEGHPASRSVEEEMMHLKAKMDAGADFILTQFFYDVRSFLDYVKRCRAYGITCPILPGIMPIQSYLSFKRMTEYCGVSVPPAVMERLEPVKDDDEAVKEIGCHIAAEMCETILSTPEEEGGVDGVHFYTLNLERSVTRILVAMGAIEHAAPASDDDQESKNDCNEEANQSTNDIQSPSNGDESPISGRMRSVSISKARLPPSRKQFPWRPSAMESRSKEDVRPINWANRPKSYVMRTDDWDEFPNGRWGDSSSPAFGELSDMSHFYNFSLGSEDDRRAMLGHSPTNTTDVYEVFARYVENKVPHIPWCETPLQPESYLIQTQLAALNRAGFLTINSQPPVNGAPSTHSTFGWGGAGGYVYQKAYCECFVSPENANKLVAMVTDKPSMNLYAVNNFGRELRVGVEEGGITALTWGVFPNREILQPTIFDPKAFLVWAEEAFSLWTSMWLNLYDFDTPSFDLIETIRDTFFLVAIIDNDYIRGGNNGVTNDGGGGDGGNGSLWEALLAVGGVEG
mmetsp:Transcript_16522/g.47426  ORF Transcript_16522/g.47426 Transcript_16522/m.47426 type:complete len:721 (+) Transcript_16522:150-2312(+)